ncbi:hypothetical protein D3C83_291120 [compost metagenome]
MYGISFRKAEYIAYCGSGGTQLRQMPVVAAQRLKAQPAIPAVGEKICGVDVEQDRFDGMRGEEIQRRFPQQ